MNMIMCIKLYIVYIKYFFKGYKFIAIICVCVCVLCSCSCCSDTFSFLLNMTNRFIVYKYTVDGNTQMTFDQKTSHMHIFNNADDLHGILFFLYLLFFCCHKNRGRKRDDKRTTIIFFVSLILHVICKCK